MISNKQPTGKPSLSRADYQIEYYLTRALNTTSLPQVKMISL